MQVGAALSADRTRPARVATTLAEFSGLQPIGLFEVERQSCLVESGFSISYPTSENQSRLHPSAGISSGEDNLEAAERSGGGVLEGLGIGPCIITRNGASFGHKAGAV